MGIRTALFGFGRTGRVVAQNLQSDERFDLLFAIRSRAHATDHFTFPVAPAEALGGLLDECTPDIVMDFSTPAAVMENVNSLGPGTGYIIATTGFREEEVERLRQYEHLRVLHAPTISDGINVVLRICEFLNELWYEADKEVIEHHFRGKVDAPSATAKRLASTLGAGTPIHSIRAGGIVGVHEVLCASDCQKITITHESFSREVFAEGAKRAAIWLLGQPCGFYDVKEVYASGNQTA
jgi:4-hydroxy-tetrahydrodipicolinate reductase